MVSRTLTRRLEHLESRFQPVGEPTILNIQFVNTDFKVVNQMQLTLDAPVANDTGKGRRSRRRHGF